MTPIASVVTPAASAVATATALNGSPAADRIAGFTNRMYDIVRKVLTPPSSSTRSDEPRAVNLKRRSRTAVTERRSTEVLIQGGLVANAPDERRPGRARRTPTSRLALV